MHEPNDEVLAKLEGTRKISQHGSRQRRSWL